MVYSDGRARAFVWFVVTDKIFGNLQLDQHSL